MRAVSKFNDQILFFCTAINDGVMGEFSLAYNTEKHLLKQNPRPTHSPEAPRSPLEPPGGVPPSTAKYFPLIPTYIRIESLSLITQSTGLK